MLRPYKPTMEGFNQFCQSNLTIIYGLYGLAFFVTGIAVALESGRSSKLALTRALPFLAAFALAHGLHEWIEMFALMTPPSGEPKTPTLIEVANVALLALSFVFLIEFAVRLVVLLKAEPFGGWSRLAAFFTALYFVAVMTFWLAFFSGDENLLWRVADISARYVLGLPGALLAGYAMFVQRRAFLREGYAQFDRDLIGAALAFAWYAFFQFIVSPSPYFPSSLINTATFQNYVGVPVQLFRAATVGVLAFFFIRVMRVFEYDYARRLEALNRARFEAQENAAHELTVLFETCRTLGTSLDLDYLLNGAIRKIVMLIEPVRAAAIFLFDADEQVLRARSSYFSGGDPPRDFDARARDAAVRAFETQQVAYVPATDGEAVLAVPLVSGDKKIGALSLAYTSAFSNLPVIQTLARQLAIAIENAQLYAQVQEKEVLRGELLERVVAAQEEERKRLARDLHDQIGQMLTGLTVGLSSVAESLENNPARARQRLCELQTMGTTAVDDLHHFVADLRPALLDDLGLVAALRAMAKQSEEHSGLQIAVNVVGHRHRLRSEFETILFRIAQEALNNTVRHARAKHVSIQLNFLDPRVVLTVQDDGIGFTPSAVLGAPSPRRAWGLLGMQERVALVGGRFEIHSAPGQGTRLVAEIPVT